VGLLNQLRLIQENSKYLKGWAESVEAIVSRLYPFSTGTLAKVFDSEKPTLSPEAVFREGVHVVNLGVLETDEAKNLLSQVLIKEVFDYGRKLDLSPTSASCFSSTTRTTSPRTSATTTASSRGTRSSSESTGWGSL